MPTTCPPIIDHFKLCQVIDLFKEILTLFILKISNKVTNLIEQWFPNGVSRGTTRCVAKLKKYIFKLILIMIKN
jgi:hypothetical protein